MTASADINPLLDKSLLIYGSGNTGKTELLRRLLASYLRRGLHVAIIDSACEHTDKSFLVKAQKDHDLCILTMLNGREVLGEEELYQALITGGFNEDKTFFPRSEISRRNILAFDVSYFLEEGHRAGSQVKRRELRKLYNCLSAQIILSLSNQHRSDQCVLLMDEIEIVPLVSASMQMLAKLDNWRVINTVRTDEAKNYNLSGFHTIRLGSDGQSRISYECSIS